MFIINIIGVWLISVFNFLCFKWKVLVDKEENVFYEQKEIGLNVILEEEERVLSDGWEFRVIICDYYRLVFFFQRKFIFINEYLKG